MHDELVRRNYAATTIRTYLHALRTCERYHRGRRLDQLGAQALRRYHAHLFREKKLAVGTVGDSTSPPCTSSLCGCSSGAS
jgi:site-specific recombinase XerD